MLTYGSTVYEKGATVAHSLRGHMGDTLFFSSIRTFLDSMKYKDVSSQQMCDILSGISGIELQGFSDSWVFTPGYPHFSVDSFLVVPNGGNYYVTVFLREKLRGRTTYSQNLQFELTFMDQQWNKHTVLTEFDGPYLTKSFTIPINPSIVMVDAEERSLDATTDNYKTLKAVQVYDFPTTYFSGTVMSIADSAFVRVEHNWVAPDTLKTMIPGLFISTERYWKIDGLFPDSINLKGKFTYNKSTASSGWLDNILMTNVADSLVLLYRPSTASDWQIISTTRTGGSSSGYLYAENIAKGEYALGIWDWDRYLSSPTVKLEKNKITLFPNPASSNVVISSKNQMLDSIEVYSNSGKKVFSTNQKLNSKIFNMDVTSFSKGFYFVIAHLSGGKTAVVKLIVE
ncbi:MAG: hypothetical protein CVU05_10665 [Bacteroidetes bacterium HGW-Bacteroidetes-21]|nr:MAG: hypothetical protein CVU05_10665 [Bacteroidetes bacterium HGW-Bacteroidetes-21]